MTIYTNGTMLQSFPVPEGPEWREATEEDVAAIEGAFEQRRVAAQEISWAAEEIKAVAKQMLMLEDNDPSALPGTVQQWRDYRIALRAWKDGAVGFPAIESRPARP